MPGRGKRRKQRAPADGEEEDEVEGEAEGDEEEAEAGPGKRRRAAASGSAAGAGIEDDGQEPEEEDESCDGEGEGEEQLEEGDDEDVGDDEGEQGAPRIWRPGIDRLEEGEQLDMEPGSYDLIHKAQVEWPCLSFDIIRDDLGAQRTTYPMTAYVVAGTQAEKSDDNRLYMMKWSRLYKTNKDGREESDDDGESESDSDDDHEAQLECKGVPHPGGVNRVRSMPQAGHIVASWADTGKVHMWHLEGQRKALDKPSAQPAANPKPIFTCDAHTEEGFALDFSPHDTGRVLSGCNDGKIFLWEPVQGGWSVGSETAFSGHSAAAEDVQWKRTGAGSQSIFASCSADRSLRVWDVREKGRKKSAVHVPDAHGSDVNVLSWSPCVGELIVTGADDGGFKIWDTRNVDIGPMANFMWHKKPITSVDWHPTDDTVLAVSADDDCVSIWDMAIEDDTAGRDLPPGAEHFPPQLMFLHQGQSEPKELRFHPQLPSVCIVTACSGFNIFKTCNI